MSKLKPESRIGEAEISQPLTTAVQIMLVNILRTWGIYPGVVIGHSSGELAAAYASGALTMQEAIICAYVRGWATTEAGRPGGMAAVGLSAEDCKSFLQNSEGKVVIACENSPINVTLSGDSEEVGLILEAIKASGVDVLVRRLHVDRAYHSRELLSSFHCCLISSCLVTSN